MLGTPDRIRTYDLWLRKPTLYPAELRVLVRMRPCLHSNVLKILEFLITALFLPLPQIESPQLGDPFDKIF